MMYWYGGPNMSPWGVVVMAIGMALFAALVIVALVLLVRYLGRGQTHQAQHMASAPHATAAQILAERYARGEIDEEEYRRRLDTITRSAP